MKTKPAIKRRLALWVDLKKLTFVCLHLSWTSDNGQSSTLIRNVFQQFSYLNLQKEKKIKTIKRIIRGMWR